MILRATNTGVLFGWILGFDSSVQVLGALSLLEKIQKEARRILAPDVTPG